MHGVYEIKEMQNFQNKIKPVIEELLHLICLEMDLDIRPEFKFEELSKQSELEKAQIEATYFDNAIKGVELGIFTDEDAVDYLQGKKYNPWYFWVKRGWNVRTWRDWWVGNEWARRTISP